MPYLVFRPRPLPVPGFFLWGPPADGPAGHVVGRLASCGQDASAPVVTDRLAVEETRGLTMPLLDAVPILADIGAADLDRIPPSVAGWSLAAKLALDLVARERILPLVHRRRAGAEARWGVSLSLPADGERFRRLARALPRAAHAVPLDDGPAPPAQGRRQRVGRRPAHVWAPDALLTEFLDAAADALVRRALEGIPAAPPSATERRWETRWLAALTQVDPPRFLTDGYVDRALVDELAAWAEPARGTAASSRPRVCFKLDPPVEREPSRAAGASKPRWTLSYFLQAPDDPSLLVPAQRVWAATDGRLGWMGRSFEAPQEALLAGLAQAARLFPPIERSLHGPRPESAALNDDDASRFLVEAAPLLAAAGFDVRVPAELTAAGQRRLRLRLRVGGATGRAAGVVAHPSALSLEDLVAYRWEVALGDEPLAAEEFRALTALKRPLVRWRGQWLVLDKDEIAEMARLVGGARGGRIPVRDALVAALSGTATGEGLPVSVEVVPEGSLARAIARLRSEPERVPPPAALSGTLRPYQERGLGWLDTMAGLGLGGCLADDMGLGKTVQTIAFLLARRAARPGDPRPALVVCPTSVVGNWERELARFAPTLPVVRYHGPDRTATTLTDAPAHAVVITTYTLLRRDQARLGQVDWAAVILDEAQNVKNAASRQAAAARALRATHRFALTGTPVENRLAELWSILEFCIPGLLGPLEKFKRRFAIPIERYRDDRAAEELRRLVRPFVLRRVKTDPAVASDLPDKQEMTVVCTLTREQATLYQAAVEEAMAEVEAASGIDRRGRILALLTALKQICNHPAHYLDEAGPLPGRSGKLERLTEMLEETLAAGDRALVFTQYREMGVRLVRHLKRALETEVLFLHGGVPLPARDVMVGRFQEGAAGPPVFVLSLRAGGTGLNLTAASRVFHFDRWWNPAVEDQATDRTHRIGQARAVQVYRLVTAGTLEEKIDAMLTDKRGLADRIVGAGEAWVTELGDDELRRLVALSSDAVVDVGDDDEAVRAPAASAGKRT
jgi:hypothetical protein